MFGERDDVLVASASLGLDEPVASVASACVLARRAAVVYLLLFFGDCDW